MNTIAGSLAALEQVACLPAGRGKIDSCTSAAKAADENKLVIAALKRCARKIISATRKGLEAGKPGVKHESIYPRRGSR